MMIVIGMLSELSKQRLTLAKEVMKFNIYVTQRVDPCDKGSCLQLSLKPETF